MDFDFNTAIQNGIERALLAHVHSIHVRLNNIEASMRLRDARHEEPLRRINELAADLGRWKGKQLEIPNSTMQNLYQTIEENVSQCASRDSFVELSREVEHLKRHVEALDHAKAKDDERFQDDVVSVLDQDNTDAKIREIVADVLNEGLAKAVADAFQNGELTISVDKV